MYHNLYYSIFICSSTCFGRHTAHHQEHTVPDNVHQTTRPTTFHVWKTRGCQCSFRLPMMGGVSSETCWASYKYRIIQILINCCISLNFSLWRHIFVLPSTKCFFHWSLESLTRSLAHPAIVLLVRTCFGKILHFVR